MENQKPSIKTHHDLIIPVNSEEIAASRYQPCGMNEQLPVLLIFTPYRKDDYITYACWDPLIRYLAVHGYEVVVADMLGTGGSSGGLKSKPLSVRDEKASVVDNEAKQAVDIINWLADQSWSNGRIGMVGMSYGGYSALAAAAENPDPLEAIIPIMFNFTSYGDSRYKGGAMSLSHMSGWLPRMHTFDALPPSYRDESGRWANIWKDRLDKLPERTPWMFDQIEHDTKDNYWACGDIDIRKIEKMNIPTFGVSGWRDVHTAETFRTLQKIDAPKRIIAGPWRHIMPHRGREAAIDFRSQVVEWFDYFLKDKDNDALDHPYIEYWTERKGGGNIGEGVWRGRDQWPAMNDPATNQLSFAFAPEGLIPASDFEEGEFVKDYKYDHTVGVNTLEHWNPPLDTGPDDVRSLCIDSSPLSQPVELTGTGTTTIRLSPTTSDLLLVARVIDVSPDGEASLVTNGNLLLSKRENASSYQHMLVPPHEISNPNIHSEPEKIVPLKPNEEHEVTLVLKPKSHIFETGHRIRVAISTSLFPGLLSPPLQGTFTLKSSADNKSLLQFPGKVHNEGVDFNNTIEMNAPDENIIPTSSPFLTDQSGSVKTSRDHSKDKATVTTSDVRTIELPHGPTMHWNGKARTSIKSHDPNALKTTSKWNIALEYEAEYVEVETTSRMTHNSAHIHQTVKIDGETIFDEIWRR